jgi:hypothetical protein
MDPETLEAQDDANDESGTLINAPEPSKSVREFIASRRAERAATESAPQLESEPKGDDEAAKGDEEKEAPKDDATKPYTDEEMATMDLRDADMSRVPPYARETVRKLQAAEARKHRELNARKQELDGLLDKAKSTTQPTASEDAPASEEDDIPAFTKEELRQVFKSRAGREFLSETLQEFGVDLEDSRERADQRFMQSAIADAIGDVPQLSDEKILSATIDLIKDNPKWAKIAAESTDKVAISLVFQAAAGKVLDAAAKAEVEAAKKEKARLEAERQKVKTAIEKKNRVPSSHAAGAQRKAPVPTGKLPVLDFIKQQREARKTAT